MSKISWKNKKSTNPISTTFDHFFRHYFFPEKCRHAILWLFIFSWNFWHTFLWLLLLWNDSICHTKTIFMTFDHFDITFFKKNFDMLYYDFLSWNYSIYHTMTFFMTFDDCFSTHYTVFWCTILCLFFSDIHMTSSSYFAYNILTMHLT